jgi:hypothetical protein
MPPNGEIPKVERRADQMVPRSAVLPPQIKPVLGCPGYQRSRCQNCRVSLVDGCSARHLNA